MQDSPREFLRRLGICLGLVIGLFAAFWLFTAAGPSDPRRSEAGGLTSPAREREAEHRFSEMLGHIPPSLGCSLKQVENGRAHIVAGDRSDWLRPVPPGQRGIARMEREIRRGQVLRLAQEWRRARMMVGITNAEQSSQPIILEDRAGRRLADWAPASGATFYSRQTGRPID
jgi:hypothetical protein